ncbi:MAG TPA: Glu-tRNA(Gln) amidotransferase GatDE subunit E [Bacteroidetes bacterium]|nr:Glu-tRNA(Gln) amidotransferase GatDE subunit E [Bacteroidota bacterium]
MEIDNFDFEFKPFEKMTDEDYAKIGFKSGLEVHQQILTEKKLFCRCPAGHYSDKYNAEILRHMRPTLSELGEYDGTALMEFKTKKEILYHINYETVCTYEMDDTPPFPMNDQALDIAIEISMLYGAHITDEVHIARKQYLDGSIPTGFQRTAIISVGGQIPYKDRFINVIQLSLEEDACREFSDIGHQRTYLTDRLGMPLIETVTAPEMRTPQEVADVNKIISQIARCTHKVRTGIGAGREDVNVSVRGGTRSEIKGVSHIEMIPKLTYNEAMRQWNLLRLREELKKRGITPDTFQAKYTDVTKLMRHSHFFPITQAISEGLSVKCIVLKGFRGLLHWQTQTDTYFSKEFSDRVRVIACLTTLPNIVHSDSQSEFIPSSEWSSLRKFTGSNEDDTLLLVWGSNQDTDTAAKEVIIRAKEATIGIPNETRQALEDCTTGFERILPGPQRMYPDTDLPPIVLKQERIENIKNNLPIPFWEKKSYFQSLGLDEVTSDQLAVSKYSNLFQKLVNELKIDIKFTADVMINYPKKLKKHNLDFNSIEENDLYEIFKNFVNGKILKESLFEIIRKTIINGKFSDELLPELCSQSELQAEIHQAIAELQSIKINNGQAKDKLLTAIVMKKLRYRANGNEVHKLITDILQKQEN